MTNNATGADNQQGRLDPWWVSGFVDGEGCFAISVFKNTTTTSGYQVFPEFVVTQGMKSLSVLEEFQIFSNAAAFTATSVMITIVNVCIVTA